MTSISVGLHSSLSTSWLAEPFLRLDGFHTSHLLFPLPRHVSVLRRLLLGPRAAGLSFDSPSV